MSFSVRVEPGRYVAGLSRPFFVSRGAVEERARKEGFRGLTWHDRDRERPPVDPKLDPKHDDDWDEWVAAEYVGRPRVMTIPARPAWLVRRGASSTPATTTTRPRPSSPAPKAAPPTRTPPRLASPASSSRTLSTTDKWVIGATLMLPIVFAMLRKSR